MDISVYSLAIVSRHARRVDARRRVDRHPDLFRRRAGRTRIQHDGRLQGGTRRRGQIPGVRPGPKKIRVNAVSAGPVKTLAASAVGDSDKLAGLYEMSSPMDRNITREEVGAAGMFLLSELASGITGEILHVDCGYNVMGSPGRAIEKVKSLILAKVQAANPDLAAAARERRRAEAVMSDRARNEPIPVGIGAGLSRGPFPGAAASGRDRLCRLLGIPRRQVRAGRIPAEATARECLEEIGLRVVVGRSGASRPTDIPTASSSCTSTTARPRTQPPSRPTGRAFNGFRPASSRRSGSPRPTRRSSRELARDRSDPSRDGLGFEGIGGSRSTTLSISP